MRMALVLLLAIGCGQKNEAGGGSAGSAAATPPPPASCPAGNAVVDGKCVPVVTPDKVQAVAQQKSRLDELSTFLGNVDQLAAPVELLNGFRQLPEWKSLAAKSDKLQIVDKVVQVLDDGVKQLRAFKLGLADASKRLGDLQGQLDAFMKDPGTVKQLADIRDQVSRQVRDALVPLGTQVNDTIQKAIKPIKEQLSDTGDLVIGACAMAKLSGGGDDLKKLCDRAKDVFNVATTYLADLEKKPAALFADVTTQVETQLGVLVDDESKKAIAAIQKQVDEQLLGSGAGSGCRFGLREMKWLAIALVACATPPPCRPRRRMRFNSGAAGTR
ncbi:MAG: hypothetical protein QM831_21615 [Kofleriaceae bacterium]